MCGLSEDTLGRRNDAKCCSSECANARRTRLYRQRRGEGYYQGARLTEKDGTVYPRRDASSQKKGKNNGNI